MKYVLTIMGILVVLLITGAAGFGWALFDVFVRMPDTSVPAVVFEIAPGEGVNQISANLKEEGLIRNKFVFETYVWLIKKEGAFLAGTYELYPGANLASLVKTFTEGAAVSEIELTFPEGYTHSQMGEALLLSPLGISSESWAAATGSDSPLEGTSVVLRDKPDSVDLEGYLFPDTYRFSSDATAEEVVTKMLATLSRRLTEHTEEIGPIENYHELLTLASIIEREVMTDEDRPIVSDIFVKRLEIGMALQADSTINYVTGKKTPSVSSEDLAIDSPYNTYMYPGLPPGPISNPGIASIIAAANPEPNDYYYFLTTPEGEVIYAETFDEHVANKEMYLR